MAALGTQVEALLAAWDDATAPLDARVREDPQLFAPELAATASSRVKRLKGGENGELCRPWDHADFLARVGSFSIAWWFAKPDAIGAFECARHGWRNSAPDLLRCNCCKRFLCFKIDDKLSEAGALRVAETFAAQLVTGHTELCPWRGNPSPAAFTALPIATKRQVYEGFVERLEEEVARMHEDPAQQQRLGRLDVAETVTAKLLQEVSDKEDGAAPLDMAAFGARLAARGQAAAYAVVWVLQSPMAGRKSTGVDDYGEIDPTLWEFVKLPGWKQYAQALSFLGNSAENAIIVVDSSNHAQTKTSDPVQALESIRAVLGL
ncbi:NIPA protein [Phytophthora cinnamomi]|uniref:NIPA protein n=1 Tax=Phytophthora cinnamomi TaxID=4785 RepID=UPI00355993D8|nr:NIPA protein [Phytophthora cinnamomi]